MTKEPKTPRLRKGGESSGSGVDIHISIVFEILLKFCDVDLFCISRSYFIRRSIGWLACSCALGGVGLRSSGVANRDCSGFSIRSNLAIVFESEIDGF